MSREGAWDFEPLQHVCCREHVEQTPGYGHSIVRCPDCHRPGIRTFNPVHVTWEDEVEQTGMTYAGWEVYKARRRGGNRLSAAAKKRQQAAAREMRAPTDNSWLYADWSEFDEGDDPA